MTANAAAVFDIDGTLVDSSYHHMLAWSRAFTRAGVAVDLWRIHLHMGMGGDRLVAAVAGDDVESRQGDEIRDLWRKAYDDLLGEVRPFDRATELLETVRDSGLDVVLATSGHPSHTDRTLGILGLGRDDYPFTTSEDAGSTKPSPELLQVAMEKVGAERGVVVGDTIWDLHAARRLGLPSVGLLTGGFSTCALQDAGAALVYDDPAELLTHAGELPRVASPAVLAK